MNMENGGPPANVRDVVADTSSGEQLQEKNVSQPYQPEEGAQVGTENTVQQQKQARIQRDISFSKTDLSEQLSAIDADESITDPNAKAEKKQQVQKEYQTAQARRITGEQAPTVKNLVAECKKLDILPTFKLSTGSEVSELNVFEKYTGAIVQNYTEYITEQLQTDEGRDLALKMMQEKTGKSLEEVEQAIADDVVVEFIQDNFLFEETIPTFQKLDTLIQEHAEEIGSETDPKKLEDFIAAVDILTDQITEFGDFIGQYVDVLSLIDLVFYGEMRAGGFRHSGRYSSERGNELGEDRTISVLNDVFDDHQPAQEFLGKLLWDAKEDIPQDMWTKKTLDKLDTFFLIEEGKTEDIAQKKERIAKALQTVVSKNITKLDKDQIVLSDKVVDHLFIKFNKLMKRAEGQRKSASSESKISIDEPDSNIPSENLAEAA